MDCYLFDTELNVPVDVNEQVLVAITRDGTTSVGRISRRIGVPQMTG